MEVCALGAADQPPAPSNTMFPFLLSVQYGEPPSSDAYGTCHPRFSIDADSMMLPALALSSQLIPRNAFWHGPMQVDEA